MNYKSDTCFSKHDNSPLTTYESEEEAQEGAKYANDTYDTNLMPYRCDTCKQWHLSPKNRHTPNTLCDSCLDRHGNPKCLYATEKDAQLRAEILYKEREILLEVYKCLHNFGWHLTKA